MKTQIIAAIISLVFLGGAFAYGYHKGSLAELQKIVDKTAQTQKKLFDLADTIREQTKKLRQLQSEKEDLINALEKEAIQSPGSTNPGIATTGGLQRLQKRWGSNSGITK